MLSEKQAAALVRSTSISALRFQSRRRRRAAACLLDRSAMMRPEELIWKMKEMERDHARLKQEMTMLNVDHEEENKLARPRFDGRVGIEDEEKWLMSPLLRRERGGRWKPDGGGAIVGGCEVPEVLRFTNLQCLNILESMGQSVHIFDSEYRIIYWNKAAQRLYGHTKEEAIGQNVAELIIGKTDLICASIVIDKVYTGESWTGQFPVINKKGERILAVATNTPLYDDHGTLVGQISVTCDSRPFHDVLVVSARTQESERESGMGRFKEITASNPGLGPQQPLQVGIASKLSNLTSKVGNNVRLRMKLGNDADWAGGTDCRLKFIHSLLNKKLFLNKGDTEISIPGGGTYHLPSGICSQVETKDKPLGRFFRDRSHEIEGISQTQTPNYIAKKTQMCIGKTGWSWSRKEKELSGSEGDANTHQFERPWLHDDQLDEDFGQRTSDDSAFNKQPALTEEKQLPWRSQGTSSSLSSCNANNSNDSNTPRNTITREKLEDNSLEHDISWKDLVIGDQIGEGSCGTVYSAKWNESEVAIKVFSKLDYADDIALSFSQETSLMRRLRHPNILLFMGAVTSGQHLCIVTEYLPRGSLFDLLKKSASKLDWRRRVSIAMDIARGMNYLHHCKPPIIHRDLKSSNLLVDRNWTVKVGDFGLSRLKLDTYLKTKSGKGTPQWMAPEVIRNEPSNEKSDVYSYGVILWELATDKVPWESLNAMQVIAAVGFMDRQLEIPKDVDPEWVSIIQSCWNSDLKSRPTFLELLERLKIVQKNCAPKAQRTRSAPGKSTHIVNSAA